ncbi:MAG: hypothetical protein AB1351_11790 [Thermoproteota archaeon]
MVRKEWNVRDREQAVNNVLPISDETVYDIVEKRAVLSGVRTPNSAKVSEDGKPLPSPSKMRHKTKMLHGMRKFFEVSLANAGFDDKWLDMIEGHKLQGLRDNYYRPDDPDDLVLHGTVSMDGRNRKPGFLEVMSELTINDEARPEREVHVLKTETSRLASKST